MVSLLAVIAVLALTAQGVRVCLVRRAAEQLDRREAIAAREQADLIQYYRDKDARRKAEHRQWNDLRWQYDKPARDRWQAERDAKYARLAKEAAEREAARPRSERAHVLRQRGATYGQIASALGYRDAAQARRDVLKGADVGRLRQDALVCTCEYITEQAICEPEPTYHLTSRNGCPIHPETP